ncbi:hypothetical protein EDB81DRAFT_663248 [Dactylonectria macrodidyma]|uniref:Amino acid transporter transmembrane domain-containing protein n=1 Tax=Dactylonectria macrodidyma TaxID=307937 RepID=A0A9P9DVI0_9HYPO|nr:hypothetical protein EDB81DRAFT_663248 [Dactylonectria macrodidyma]
MERTANLEEVGFIFALGGTPLFFPIAAAMRDIRLYNRTLIACQAIVTGTCVFIGCVVYEFCGSYVASPALGSAGSTIKKAGYAIALLELLVTTTLVVHVISKHVFVRILRNSKHLVANMLTHWASWLGCTFGVSGLAYIIASAVPNFGGLVALVVTLFGTLMAFQPMGCMWLHDNWGTGKGDRTLKWAFGVCWASFVALAGMFLMVADSYGAIKGLIESSKVETSAGLWSCADGSN